MTFKCTMLMQDSTNISNPGAPIHRIGGWSESWYFPGTNLQSALVAFVGVPFTSPFGGPTVQTPSLCSLRAAMLPLGSAVVGQRFQQVAPLGLAQSTGFAFPGASGLNTNVPQAALLLKVPGLGVKNIRRSILRALPYEDITQGEFNFGQVYGTALQAFIQQLAQFQFQGRDLSQATNSVLTISAAGLVQAIPNIPYAVGDMVRILKARDSSGNLRGGKFLVATIGPLASNVTLTNWPFGACTGGSIRKEAVIFPTIDATNTAPARVVIKKVGRPFVQFRGRRSRRR